MKLSKLYSNKPALFSPVDFVSGLNVILAEIRLPENQKKDTHNLGKTTIGRLLDFCFLSTRNPDFFLFKHPDIFDEFVFFLEIELTDTSFVTVRRGVENQTKICFLKHKTKQQNLSDLLKSKWDHIDMPFKRAKKMLNSMLDWREINPWSYRKGLGYLLRSQDDFHDVFRLDRFAGRHSDWKPYLAHILGFDAQLLDSLYKTENLLKEKKEKEKTINQELGGSVEDISKIEGLLLLKQNDAEKKQQHLDAFDFQTQDMDYTKQLVDEIDEQIATLNTRRYFLKNNLKKILASIKDDKFLFNIDEAQQLFKQAGVLFQGQIKRSYQHLLAFNRAVTDERRLYLKEERNEIEAEIQNINTGLKKLNNRRSEILAFLSNTDVFKKYKDISDKMVTVRADITSLERQRVSLHHLQNLRTDIRTLTEKCREFQTQIERDVEKQNTDKASMFSSIRLFFSEIVEEVISHKALLSVSPNKKRHLEFKAEILDESGNTTSADLGHTYRKLLCIAFDLAVLRAHLKSKFPRFVFHDGLFESLDDRKKVNLLTVIRKYADLGIQPIITLIDSDLPPQGEKNDPVFGTNEIILTLHDENERGRLFKTKTW